MSYTNGNHSAGNTFNRDGATVNIGLTKRELFAAMAMQGILSGSADIAYEILHGSKGAVRAADALIAELNKEVQS